MSGPVHQPYDSHSREGDTAPDDHASNHSTRYGNPSGTTAGTGGRCCSCLSGVLGGAKKVVHTIMPAGGIVSSAFNMASSSIGAGILGLPGATDSCGLVLAMIYLVIITFFSVYSMRILSIVAEKTRIRSFEGLGRWLFPYGNYAFSYWAAFIRWFHAFAANVAYIISIGNCFTPILEGALNRSEESKQNKALQYLNTTSGHRLLQSLVWLCIMLPLVVPKHVDSLRYASAFAVTFMIYFVIIIVVHSAMHGLPENASKVHVTDNAGYDPKTAEDNAIFLFRSGNSVVNSVGVFVFAYVCQINALEIHSDMRPEVRTTRNYTWAAFLGMMICGTLYALVCVFGYFDFGSKYLQNQSILLMYSPLDEPAVLVAYVGVMCKLCVAYALLTIASRNSIYYIIGWQHRYAPRSDRVAATGLDGENSYNDDGLTKSPRDPQSLQEQQLGKGCADVDALAGDIAAQDSYEGVTKTGARPRRAAVPPEYRHTESDEEVLHDDTNDTTYIDNIPYWKHLIVVLALSVASLLCGMFIPSINMVFGFAGSVSGAFMAFIFPALFYMYSGNFTFKSVGMWDYCLTYALLIVGVIGVVFGTAGTIYNTI